MKKLLILFLIIPFIGLSQNTVTITDTVCKETKISLEKIYLLVCKDKTGPLEQIAGYIAVDDLRYPVQCYHSTTGYDICIGVNGSYYDEYYNNIPDTWTVWFWRKRDE